MPTASIGQTSRDPMAPACTQSSPPLQSLCWPRWWSVKSLLSPDLLPKPNHVAVGSRVFLTGCWLEAAFVSLTSGPLHSSPHGPSSWLYHSEQVRPSERLEQWEAQCVINSFHPWSFPGGGGLVWCRTPLVLNMHFSTLLEQNDFLWFPRSCPLLYLGMAMCLGFAPWGVSHCEEWYCAVSLLKGRLVRGPSLSFLSFSLLVRMYMPPSQPRDWEPTGKD